MTTSKQNYCKRGMMSMCTAKEQKNCKYFAKSSTNSKRCMHFTFEEFCDCMEAQFNLDKKEDKKEEEKEKTDGIEVMQEAQEAYLEQVKSNKKILPNRWNLGS